MSASEPNESLNSRSYDLTCKIHDMLVKPWQAHAQRHASIQILIRDAMAKLLFDRVTQPIYQTSRDDPPFARPVDPDRAPEANEPPKVSASEDESIKTMGDIYRAWEALNSLQMKLYDLQRQPTYQTNKPKVIEIAEQIDRIMKRPINSC
jgi:hypothetical protein